MEDGTLGGRGEFYGKLHDSALVESVGDLLTKDMVDGGLAVGKVDEFTFGDADFGAFIDPDLTAAGVVNRHWEVAKGLGELGFVALACVFDSKEGRAALGFVVVDFTTWLPGSFVLTAGDLAVRSDTDAAGGT